jgi:myosin heavy subunit
LKERNYHIFYQLTAAAQVISKNIKMILPWILNILKHLKLTLILQRDTSLANQYQVHPPSTYHYLNQSGCTKLDGVDDAAKVKSF